ncbi:MAG: TolC family protein, partial [Candidatus Eisenbacteria bacterium]|nr:TolC family protein [Candidatus Eisenbacteria bacterium]
RLAGAATRYQKPMLVTPIHGLGGGSLPPFDRTILTGSATLGYLLFDGGGRGARVGEARHAESSAEAAVREAEQATIAEVLAAYLDARAAGEAVQAHDLRIEALRSERERVSRRLIEGKAARVELLRAEAAVAAAQADREAEAAGLEVAERRLATLIQEPVDSTRFSRLIAVSLRDGGIEDRNRLVQRALDSNASVARQREEARAAGSRRDAVASRRWPEVRLAGNLLLYSNAEDADAEEWNAGAQLSAPLFTGGAISSAIRRAEAGERAAAARLRATEDRVRSEIDRALAAIEETQARVRSLETAVASYEEVARIEALSLEAGSATQNDYLQAEAQLLLARANRIRAANAEVQARVALARLIGVLDPAWIEESLEANR